MKKRKEEMARQIEAEHHAEVLRQVAAKEAAEAAAAAQRAERALAVRCWACFRR